MAVKQACNKCKKEIVFSHKPDKKIETYCPHCGEITIGDPEKMTEIKAEVELKA